jgi:anion-transporting  ArsA/GET3 family ATPase
LPLAAQRLIVVTGKGGVGKSSVTAALARALADTGRRVLAVEIGRARLGPLLEVPEPLASEPIRVTPTLSAATVEPEDALTSFVHGMLRVPVFARRLLESTSFQVVAAAAPGLAEFLVLHMLQEWLELRRLGRPRYDALVVDAPASGHSLPLLAAPRTLGTLARIGPVAETLGAIDRRLRDPAQTLVLPVTIPEELAVRETVELHRELTGLGVPVGPVIVNAMPRRRFAAADEERLASPELATGAHPYLQAARFEIARRRRATAQTSILRRELGRAVVKLPFLYEGPEGPGGIASLAERLAVAAGIAA